MLSSRASGQVFPGLVRDALKILVIYHLLAKGDRNTIDEYLYSFKRYSQEDCYYLNAAYGIPSYIVKANFDLVIYDYTFLYHFRAWADGWYEPIKILEKIKCYKAAMPQDEYTQTDALCQLFQKQGVKTVFTCLMESEWQKVYPRDKSGLDHYITALAGYIDENTTRKIVQRKLKPHRSRPIDIGYRARKNPYWTGWLGVIKWRLTEVFLSTPVKHGLKLDLSNSPKDVLYGADWYKFLADCRVVLGCESGSSILDADGSIAKKVDAYTQKHPGAGYDEVEMNCFPGRDSSLGLFTISPRHFEACLTRTCQALVEGEYNGILKPGVHYIEVKRDWSNLQEVLNKIKDVDYCESIADHAYRDIVESGRYTYQKYVQMVLEHVKNVTPQTRNILNNDRSVLRMLELREKFPFCFSPLRFTSSFTKYHLYKLLVKLNMYNKYQAVKAKLVQHCEKGLR
jgi:hypothetical protein